MTIMNRENVTPIGRIKHILTELPFFEEFTDAELDYFTSSLSLRYFPTDTVLFQKDDIGDYLFFIVEGKVEVRLEAVNLRPIIIATFERGCCVGEMSMVDEFSRSATVVVKIPSELLLLTRTRFESVCQQNPLVGLKFLRNLARDLSIRLRKTTGRFADLA